MPIYCFSQTIYPKTVLMHNDSIIMITSQQLKQTNLIFSDYSKTKIELDMYKDRYLIQEKINLELYKKINLLEQENNNLIQSNNYYNNALQSCKQSNNKNIFYICGIGVSFAVVTILILK